METAQPAGRGAFRREPGDWPCSQCGEVNFKSRNACRRCAIPRQQTAPAVAPQNEPRPGDWTCASCNNLNFAARTACNKCGIAKQQSHPIRTAPTVPTVKPGDWKCSSCPEINFGSRVVCRTCGTARSTDETKKSNECVICMEKPIDSVITSCGHSALCLECGSQVTHCPICRNPFVQDQLIKLFNVH